MGFVTILREVLTDNEMNNWGWRIPFLSSVILGVVGLYMRKNLHESEEFMKVKNRGLTTRKYYQYHNSFKILLKLLLFGLLSFLFLFLYS